MKNLPEVLLKKVCKELHQAGMNAIQINEVLKIGSTAKTRKLLGLKEGEVSFTNKSVDRALVNEILYDANVPIAKEEIVRIEKERYVRYAQVEEKSLEIMVKLLSHYSKQPIGVDLKEDRFKAELASNFIKATQQCREEILRKYEIETRKSSEDNKILVEFVDPISVNNKQ